MVFILHIGVTVGVAPKYALHLQSEYFTIRRQMGWRNPVSRFARQAEGNVRGGR